MRRRLPVGFIISFLAPAVLIYAAFVVWPLLQTLQLSLYRWRGLSGSRRFVGFENFDRILHDPTYWQTLTNVLVFTLIMLPILTGAGLLLAHALEGNSKVDGFGRAVYLLPHMVAVVAVAALWMFLLHPTIGIFGRFGPQEGWLGNPKTALGAVMVAFFWYALGFYVLLYGAGLRQIPEEVRESSRLDGASGWQSFRHIAWPMLWSVRKVAVPYVVINVFGIFALVMVMTGGGQPDRATETPLTLLYERGFQESQFSQAITMGAINFIIAMLIGGLLLFAFRRNPEGTHAS
jgi:ABC-type sugar transport system permease subunit